jgi:hypothetical protein
MSYRRVIPRDLFNEANLLKCYGTLYIALDHMLPNGGFDVEDVEQFEIVQSPEDGSIFIDNLTVTLGKRSFRLKRPLNARRPYPLYAHDISDPDFDPVDVFTDEGALTEEFLALVPGK